MVIYIYILYGFRYFHQDRTSTIKDFSVIATFTSIHVDISRFTISILLDYYIHAVEGSMSL